MIKEMQRLLDGNYLIRTEGLPIFYGSRLEMLEYLTEQGFGDEQVDLFVQVLDSLPAVNLPATRQAYC